MSDTKLLQAILDVQNVLGEEIRDVKVEIRGVRKELGEVDSRLTSRIDKLGSQLTYLEEDAPTREVHDNLEKRVVKIEKAITS